MRCACDVSNAQIIRKTMDMTHEDKTVYITNAPIGYCYECDTTIISAPTAKRLVQLSREACEKGIDIIVYNDVDEVS